MDKVRSRFTPEDLVAGGLFGLMSVAYMWLAIAQASTSPFWMDEVLALWTAQMPDLHHVWIALQKGAEFTPPLYDSFLHLWMKAGASTPLMLRLPSIIAGYFAALAMGALMRRHASWPLAALAAGTVLAGVLLEYAVQIRPYIFVTAAFGWALVLWDGLPDKGAAPAWRLMALGLLLVAMTALHFYAVLLVALLGLAECVRGVIRRRMPRLSVLAVVAMACCSILCWWPILQAASYFSGQDVFAPDYYGQPRPEHLFSFYIWLAGWPGVLALGMSLILLTTRRDKLDDRSLVMLAGLLCAAPLGIFLFALLFTHSFAARYAIASTFGIALLLAWAIDQLGCRALLSITLLMLLTASLWGRGGSDVAGRERLNILALAASAPGDVPIATGSGLRFFELRANATPAVARRLVYLDLPHSKSADPTNRHQVERWKAINNALPVVEAERFVCSTPRFLLLTDPDGGTDDVPHWLATHASFSEPPRNRPALTEVRSLPCPKVSH